MGITEVTHNRAIFLDRDGVINRNVLDPATGEYGAPLAAEDFELTLGAIEAMRSLRDAGFLLFLISNQPNCAKGKSSLADLEAIHRRLTAALQNSEIDFAEFYYCYHHPQGVVDGYPSACECRKPSPYFVFRAQQAFGLTLEKCWIVGDRTTDIECGRSAGMRTVRVKEDHPAKRDPKDVEADFEAWNLSQAASIILKQSHE